MKLIDVQRPYHLFVGLGSACDPAAHLRRHGLRKFSMPLDWVVSNMVADVTRVFRNRFSGFMELDALKPVDGSANYYDEDKAGTPEGDSVPSTYFVEDTHSKILSVHDFPNIPGQPWHAAYPQFKEKLDMRIDRLLKSMAESPSTLFVRWAGRTEEAVELRSVLSSMTGGTTHLLVLQPHDEATSVTPEDTDHDGVCLVSVPNLPGDSAVWDGILKGMSLEA